MRPESVVECNRKRAIEGVGDQFLVSNRQHPLARDVVFVPTPTTSRAQRHSSPRQRIGDLWAGVSALVLVPIGACAWWLAGIGLKQRSEKRVVTHDGGTFRGSFFALSFELIAAGLAFGLWELIRRLI